nr:MAG TPA: hypothetical protein [Caudoviricetes sp.]
MRIRQLYGILMLKMLLKILKRFLVDNRLLLITKHILPI